MDKVLRNISNYVVGKDLQVIDTVTGEIVTPLNSGEIRLETDEEMHLPLVGKTINLVRRFTTGQLKKLYEQSDTYAGATQVPNNATTATESPKLDATQREMQRNEDENATDCNDATQRYSIDGVIYATLSEASKALGVNKSTIKRRLDNGKEGYLYV